MSQTINLTPEVLAALQAAGLLTSTSTSTTAPANGKAKPTAKAPAAAGPYAGKSLSDMQAAIDADPTQLPLVKAELEHRVKQNGKSAGNAQKALARLASGGQVSAPKGDKASAFAQTPEEELAERTAKLHDHLTKLKDSQAVQAWIQAQLPTAPVRVQPGLTKMLESVEREITQRQEWIATQEAGITKLGFPVPGTPPAKRTSTRSRRTTKAA